MHLHSFRSSFDPANATFNTQRVLKFCSIMHDSVNLFLNFVFCSSVFKQASSQLVAEKVVTAIKQGRFDDSIFIAQHTSAHLTVDYQCLPGQVLKSITDFAAKACCELAFISLLGVAYFYVSLAVNQSEMVLYGIIFHGFSEQLTVHLDTCMTTSQKTVPSVEREATRNIHDSFIASYAPQA